MNVTCPECRSVFRVDPAKVMVGGVRARCSVCGGVITIVERPSGSVRSIAGTPVPAETPPQLPTPASAPPARQTPASLTPVRPTAALSITPPLGAPVVVQSPRVMPPAGIMTPRTTMPRAVPPTVPPESGMSPSAAKVVDVRPTGMTPPTVRVVPPSGRVVRGTPGASPTIAPPFSAARAGEAPRSPAVPPAVPAAAPVAVPVAVHAAVHATPIPPTHSAPPPPATAPPDHASRRPLNPFLANDPHAKAKRLARALVSDMIVYLPHKRDEGLRDGTLKQIFREEIKKSYEEYIDQIGRDIAESTTHFQDALNDLLAGGQKIF